MAWLGGWGAWGGSDSGARPGAAAPDVDLSVLPPQTQPAVSSSSLPPPEALGTVPMTMVGGAPAASTPSFAVGEVVEYYSASQGAWIAAKILTVNPSGTYGLDCKPDVTPEKIRRRQSAFDGAEHRVGDVIEYNSASQGRWIPAKVIAINARGTYDLDCKPGVEPSKIRRMSQSERSAMPKGTPATVPATSLRALSPSQAGRSPTSPGPAEPDAPVQLLRVNRSGSKWRYEVCPEGVAFLERHGARRIAVASVCGLYRTGKSYLLNLLLERVQHGLPLFQVGATTRACTEGLWLWGSLGGADDERSPLLAFIDCEGFGSTESDQTRDAQLMTLCALLSSVLVLNTKGALNEGLFNSLALTCRFAEHIEERGNEASRPALLWVLRDFMLELQDSSGRSVTPDEYLEQALQAAPATGYNQDRGQSAREARQSLLKFFSHRSCATLVQPAVEESQLQELTSLPYSSLRGEFRSGIEALRAQLVAACHASPKTVGGEPIGCRAFAGLLKQLVEALNASRSLSVRGAWEAVQHSTCGQLADQLRTEGSQALRVLAQGQRLPNGAMLPMADESLRELLRNKRHDLKARWDERAVGDAAVRKEYWQELKESLAREELVVRQQNARLADQKLMEVIRRWQAWLDDDDADAAAGERISADLGQLMDRMPAVPLSRAGRTALEAAARRVTAARAAISATAEHFAEAQRRAETFGEHASRQEGATRGELDARRTDLQETQERLRRLEQEAGSGQVELQARGAELQDAKAQLQAALQDMEDARQREHELRAQHRITNEREVALKAELEEVRAAAVKAEADRVAAESGAAAAGEASASETRRLEEQVRAAKAEAERYAEQLASERAVLEGHTEKHRTEHMQLVEDARRQLDAERSTLKGEHDKTRVEHERQVEEARQKLEQERQKHADTVESEQQRILESERKAGLLEGQVAGLSTETSALRHRVAELQAALREAECKSGQHVTETERLRRDLDRAHADVESSRKEAETQERAVKDRFEKESAASKLREVEAVGKKGGKSFGCTPFGGRRAALA